MRGSARRCGKLGEAEVREAEHPHIPVTKGLSGKEFYRIIAVIMFIRAV